MREKIVPVNPLNTWTQSHSHTSRVRQWLDRSLPQRHNNCKVRVMGRREGVGGERGGRGGEMSENSSSFYQKKKLKHFF